MNTESLQKLSVKDGLITCEFMDYFCNLLKDLNPDNDYIYLRQGLADPTARILHATEINIKRSKSIFFVFNRSEKFILEDNNLANLNHWAAVAFLSNGEVILADSIYNTIPQNFFQCFGDYYKIKYDKEIDAKCLTNLSGRKNFPSQRGSSICGLVTLMIVILLDNEKIVDLFKFNS